jgi:hypothetical protein
MASAIAISAATNDFDPEISFDGAGEYSRG